VNKLTEVLSLNGEQNIAWRICITPRLICIIDGRQLCGEAMLCIVIAFSDALRDCKFVRSVDRARLRLNNTPPGCARHAARNATGRCCK